MTTLTNKYAGSWLMILATLFCLAARAAESVEAEARRTGKGVIILQVGSDWCVSGEKVRKVFESEEFRKKVAEKFVLAVYDEAENISKETAKANERTQSLLMRTQCFPAMTCYTPAMKISAHHFCISQDITADNLAAYAQAALASGKEIERLSAEAGKASGEAAANLYGQIFDMFTGDRRSMQDLEREPSLFKEITTGKHGWNAEWEALCKLDEGDKYGWTAHFRMNAREQVKMVQEVTKFSAKDRAEAEAYIKKARDIPTKHMAIWQAHGLADMMDYAMETEKIDQPLSPRSKEKFKKLANPASGIWGYFARGKLVSEGEMKPFDRPQGKLLPRNGKPKAPAKFMLTEAGEAIKGIKPGDKLTEAQKLQIARYAALRLIGEEGWKKLAERPGSGKFAKAFLNDRTWLEDFAWNGMFSKTGNHQGETNEPGAGAGAILALESLVFQDKGQWLEQEGKNRFKDNDGRRFITALALNYPEKDEAWLTGAMAAFRNAAKDGRLHKTAYGQPVWRWRMALSQSVPPNNLNESLMHQYLLLDPYINIPAKEYLKWAKWTPAFNAVGCFGGRPWEFDKVLSSSGGEDVLTRYAPATGGTALKISSFATVCAGLRGMPCMLVRQHGGHFGFSVRQPDGIWPLCYNVIGPSYAHFCFWPHEAVQRPWQYVTAVESTFGAKREVRHAADRMMALAILAEEQKGDRNMAEKFYKYACATHPGHYGAWLEYERFLLRTESAPEQMHKYIMGALKSCKAGNRPMWDLLTPYVEYIARTRGAEELEREMRELEPVIKREREKLDEEVILEDVVEGWCKVAGEEGAKALERVFPRKKNGGKIGVWGF